MKGESYAVQPNPIRDSYDRNQYGGLPPSGLHRAAGQDLIHGLSSPRGGAGMARPPRPENYQHMASHGQYANQHVGMAMQTPVSNY